MKTKDIRKEKQKTAPAAKKSAAPKKSPIGALREAARPAGKKR